MEKAPVKPLNHCDQCKYTKKKENNIANHMQKAHVKPLDRCNQSGLTQNFKEDLPNHMKKAHVKPPRQCDQCGHTQISKVPIRNHIGRAPVKPSDIDTEEIVNCNQCGDNRTSPSNLKNHTHNEHSDLTVTSAQNVMRKCQPPLDIKCTREDTPKGSDFNVLSVKNCRESESPIKLM